MQRFVEGREDLAIRFAHAGILESYAPGQTFITQGASDNDLFLIVFGQAAVVVNGRKINERKAGQHVGEMALIDPTTTRSATLVAETQVVALRVSETAFSEIANGEQRIWRLIAIELAERLRQRNTLVRVPNSKPHIFIGSSGEASSVALAIEAAVAGIDAVVRVWTSGVFEASETAIESLESAAQLMDFAVLVFSADDKVFSRKKDHAAPRDNVIFELGLFMGALGRKRTFIVAPKTTQLKVPSDLLGITQLRYPKGPKPLAERLEAVCKELLKAFDEKGPK